MKFVALIALLAPVSGHNWLAAPPSRNGNKAQTAKPCPPAGALSPAPLVVSAGADIVTTWTQNHGGDHYIKIAATEAELEAATALVTMPTGTPTATVSAPMVNGAYVLQYGWNGYRNCVDLMVGAGGATSAGGNSTNGTAAAGTDASAMANCETYCIDIEAQCTGASAQYSDRYNCLASCAVIPQTGSDGDSSGNTLQCRWYHIHVEEYGGSEHCVHAGYSGGGPEFCGGGAYVPGVAFSVEVMSPPMTPLEMQSNITMALIENGFSDCLIVALPVLTTDATYRNIFEITVTFNDCSSSHTGTDAIASAAALGTTEVSALVTGFLTSKNPTIISAEVSAKELTDVSNSAGVVAPTLLLVALAALA